MHILPSKTLQRLMLTFLGGSFLAISCHKGVPWQLGPFVKVDSLNPVLAPIDSTVFACPVSGNIVHWESKDVFNPAAVIYNGKVCLLYRAEDSVGRLNGTSRIGLAESEDGLHFRRMATPVFYPDSDRYLKYEWEGGCEDPRIVRDDAGLFYMTYTAWNGENATLSVATSRDLRSWTKHGPCFLRARGGKYLNTWSKSGAIICREVNGEMVATRINGRYWMYWGDTKIFLATSDDLVNWDPVDQRAGVDSVRLMPVFGPRKGMFDSDLVEPGPSPVLTDHGIWMIYNSRNAEADNDPALVPGSYSAGQILFDREDPTKVISRAEQCFITPDKDYEITGQVNRVCFVEGIVHFDGRWLVYYGTADSKIAMAACTATLR